MKHPTEIPGDYEITRQPFPDAEWIIGRKRPSPFEYGLFAYMQPYRKFREQVRNVGWRHLRMGGPLNRADMQTLADDGMRVSVHLADGAKRNEYATDEDFLDDVERRAEQRLAFWANEYYFHVWNEPNGGYMLAGANTPEMLTRRATLYAKVLLRVSAVVRAKRRDAKIIGFDVARPGPNAVDFIQQVYASAQGIHEAYDIMAIHPGVDPAPPECDLVKSYGSYSIARTMEGVRAIMRKQHSQKPVWWTEAGWLADPPEIQAAYLCRYYAWAMRLAVECVTPFFIVDADGKDAGVFDEAGRKPRLAAEAIQNMIRIMPCPKLVEAINDGPELYGYRFRTDVTDEHSGTIVMAWAIEGAHAHEFSLSSNVVKVTDMLGESETMESPSGNYQIEVGPCPIYVEEM